MAAVSPVGEVWPAGQGSRAATKWRATCFHAAPFQVCGKQQDPVLLDQLPAGQATTQGSPGLRDGPDPPGLAALEPSLLWEGAWRVAARMQSPLKSVSSRPHKMPPWSQAQLPKTDGCVLSNEAQGHTDICRATPAFSLPEEAPPTVLAALPETAPISQLPRRLLPGSKFSCETVIFLPRKYFLFF